MEQTFVMIKPDGVQRGLIGEVLTRFESKGLKIKGFKLIRVTKELATQHYQEHQGKVFYSSLIEYITGDPVAVMILEGRNAVKEVRKLNGSTNPLDALPGTIRGDFAQDIGRNVVHGSDSRESAQREISIYFTPEEILDYDYMPDKWLYE